MIRHLRDTYDRLDHTGRIFQDIILEEQEVVGFLRSLARGISLSLRSNNRICLCGSQTVTLWAERDFLGAWCLERLPGFPREQYRTLVSFASVVRAVPARHYRNLRSIPNWTTPRSQRGLEDEVYARSFVLTCRVNRRGHGTALAQVLLTTDTIECCYRLCMLLMLSKKYVSQDDFARRHICTPSSTLMKIAPTPPYSHCLSSTFKMTSQLYTPRNHYPRYLTTTKLRVGLRVEVNYYDDMVIKTEDREGNRGRVPLPVLSLRRRLLFGPGKYCIAKVVSYHQESGKYDLLYLDGPFDHSEPPSNLKSKKPRLFHPSTEFIDVDKAFLQVELAETYKQRPPYFMLAISAVQVLYFFIYCIEANETPTFTEPTAGNPALWFKLVGKPNSWRSSNNDYPDCSDLRTQVWRFWSYQLVHKGISHVGFNVFLQLLLGIPLEFVHGSVRMALIYQMGVYLGAIACAVGDIYTNVVGASVKTPWTYNIFCAIFLFCACLLCDTRPPAKQQQEQ